MYVTYFLAEIEGGEVGQGALGWQRGGGEGGQGLALANHGAALTDIIRLRA